MVVKVRDNIRDTRRTLKRWQRRQIPFAASLALNNTAFVVRKFIVQRLWPDAFPRARNRRLPGVMFRVQKARKTRLQSQVFDRLARDFVDHHIEGRPKRPFRSSHLAVPINVKRLASGKISAARRPESLPNSFEADFGRGPAIWQRQRNNRLKLMYSLKSQTPVRASFHFFRLGLRRGEQAWPREFEKAIARALRTARR